MQGFHIPAAPPLYTNTFLLISDAGHAVVIDPAAEVHSYDEILKQHNATLTTILCTHGHYDHVGSAAALKAEWNAILYCEKGRPCRRPDVPAFRCGLRLHGRRADRGGRAALYRVAHPRPHPRQRGAAVR